MNFISGDGLKQRLPDKGWHSLNKAISIFYVDVDSKCGHLYTISDTLRRLVGIGSSWLEKANVVLMV